MRCQGVAVVDVWREKAKAEEAVEGRKGLEWGGERKAVEKEDGVDGGEREGNVDG